PHQCVVWYVEYGKLCVLSHPDDAYGSASLANGALEVDTLMLRLCLVLLVLTVLVCSDQRAGAVDEQCLDETPRHISVTGTVFADRVQCELHGCPDRLPPVTNESPLMATLHQAFCVKNLEQYVDLTPYRGMSITPLTVSQVRLVESPGYTGPPLRELA